jgi:RNA polymerase sigma factor (sigma-70 family)
MQSPFVENAQELPEADLVARAQTGDREAAGELLVAHQPWIFNLALRMLGRRADAEDATQEILIRVLRALPSFRGEARFRTWLYRIAVNYILDMRKANRAVADAVCSFSDAAHGLRQVPDFDPPDPRTVPVPIEVLLEETKVGCIMGTLLCLDGRQRLVYVLGEVFGASDAAGAEIAGVTPANFRQILSRARRDLGEYLRGNCSLVNPDAHCRCAKKMRAYIQGGFVDPHHLQFTADYQRKVRDVVDERADQLAEAYMKMAANVYRDHPFYEPAGQAAVLRQALESVSLAPPV